LTEWR